MRSCSFLSILALLCGLGTTSALAQFVEPLEISFQGYLTDTLGEPMDSNDVSITFTVYNELDNAIWTETQSVDANNGVFHVYLGAVVSLDTVDFRQPFDLGIKLDGESSEIAPRTQLAAAPYALGLRGLRTVYASTATRVSYNLIGGATNNYTGDVVGATIGGGGGLDLLDVANAALGNWATVSGGKSNEASADRSTVGGGWDNTAGGSESTVAGGQHNTAGGSGSTVAGGEGNAADGTGAAVGGGVDNTAGGENATVPGGHLSAAMGYTSFAAGYQARANHDGTFVWQDSTGSEDDTLASTASNQFLARASGGFSFLTQPAPDTVNGVLVHAEGMTLRSDEGDNKIRFTNSTDTLWSLGVSGNLAPRFDVEAPTGAGLIMSANRATGSVAFGKAATVLSPPLEMASGAHVTAGGVWTDASSKTLKEDFESVDPADVLKRVADLPITSWRYKKEPAAVHMGPVAEDFYASFALGADDKHIAALDGNGVALAAIQGLYELVKELQAENEGQRAEIAKMRTAMTQAGIQ